VNSDDTQQLTADLRAAVADLRTTLGDARNMVNNADGEIADIASKLDPTLQHLDSAIVEGGLALSGLKDQIGADSEVKYELVNTLNEIQAAARALRALLEYLEQNPEAIIRGKRE